MKFYAFFKPLFLISNIFGLTKPMMTSEGTPRKNIFWLKLWSLVICVALIFGYAYPLSTNEYLTSDLKHNLDAIADINALVVNVAIMIINLLNSDQMFINLRLVIDSIFDTLNLDNKASKLFAIKMYSWCSIPTIIFVALILIELSLHHPPYTLLLKIPSFLMIVSLVMHLYLILAFLKVINDTLSIMLNENNDIEKVKRTNYKVYSYIIKPEIRFIGGNDNTYVDLKMLCKVYDDLATCIHLLEKCNGLQILLYIWAMFFNALIGVTVLVNNQTKMHWLVFIKSILPLSWYFIGCLVDDQLQKEVDTTITILIKCLIDYKCDLSRKSTVEIFKQLVCNDCLQFTACNLFYLNYSLLLNTVLNVITYSIILIQLISS